MKKKVTIAIGLIIIGFYTIMMTYAEVKIITSFRSEPTYKELQDSIVKLSRRPVMTADQFIKVYKYETLLKYYKICKKKPSQWKYYKGWSIRVFEQ